MLGQIEVALRKDRPVEDYHRVLNYLQRQGHHLRRIIEGLLFLARADSEGRLTELEPIDLSAWLAEPPAVLVGTPALERSDTDRSIRHEHAWVAGQPALLGEMVNNLLDNAFKYSQPGTPVPDSLENLSATIQLHIEDRGIGIRQDEHAGPLPALLPGRAGAEPRHRRPGPGTRRGRPPGQGLWSDITVTSREGEGNPVHRAHAERCGRGPTPGSPDTALVSAAELESEAFVGHGLAITNFVVSC